VLDDTLVSQSEDQGTTEDQRVEEPAASFDFQLDGQQTQVLGEASLGEFSLEMEVAQPVEAEPDQIEFFLPEIDEKEDQDQLEFDTMERPVHWVGVDGMEGAIRFQSDKNLLESLEAQQVQVPYQCREGYCGSCRTQLISGQVAYLQEPMAWLNDGEILPCCCVPKSDLKLKLKG